MSITKSLFVKVMSLIMASLVVMFSVMAYMDYRSFDANMNAFQEELINTYRDLTRAEAEGAANSVRLARQRTQDRLKEQLRRHVDEAYRILWSIYSAYSATHSLGELKKMAAEALRPIRFLGGRGYYFAFTKKGVVGLHGGDPSLEGKNDLRVVNAEGRYVVRECIDMVEKSGEGFLQYLWKKPDHPGESFRKLSYIKFFEPLDWVIGAGEYLDDVEENTQTRILRQLASISFAENGYIFVGTYQGTPLLGQEKGREIFEVRNKDGNNLLRRIIETAREGGGFVSYNTGWTEEDSGLKISYVLGLKDWGWYIGAGTAPGAVEARLFENQRNARRILFIKMGVFFFLGVLVVTSGMWIVRRFAGILGRDFSHFTRFLENGDNRIAPMNTDPLKFDEFRTLGMALNSMVERVLEADNSIKRSLAEKETLLQEIHHRVKNNLQIVSSLLQLQTVKIDDKAALQALQDSSLRVMSMAQVHDQLYNSGNLESIDIRLYVEQIWQGLCRSVGLGNNVGLTLEGGSLELPLYKAVPCGLILSELLTNALKHGFPDPESEGQVFVTLKQVGGNVSVSVSDNGKGLPKGHDVFKSSGLGLQLVSSLAGQLGGGVDWYHDTDGFTVKLRFSLEAE